MSNALSHRWLVVAAAAAMLLVLAAGCSAETVEVPGETVVIEKEVVKTVEVPGQTVIKEVVKTVEVPGQTVVVEKEVVKTVEVPGETVVVEVLTGRSSSRRLARLSRISTWLPLAQMPGVGG